MKYTHTILAMAALGAALISCSRTLSPVEEPSNLKNEIAKLNGNIAVLQAVGQGEYVNSVKADGSDYNILLCNGRELTLSGNISANAPEISVKDGIWTVGGEALRCGSSEEGLSVEVLPEVSVNAEGEWTLSAEGSTVSFGKAIATAATPYFEQVLCTETQLSLTPKSASTLSSTVASGFLFKIDATGAQDFVLGQTRTYSVTRTGVSAATVVVPEGWTAELTESQISITAPSTVSTKAVIASSKTDVSVIAVSTAGYVTIAKVETSLDEGTSASDPFATLTLGTVGAFSAEVTVALQNNTGWYYLLKKSSEAAPSKDELKAATAGSDTALTLATDAETTYTLYVLPVNGDTDGGIAKISFTTAALTSYYEAWEAGKEIKIGSKTYSKAVNGKAMLMTSPTAQKIEDTWVNGDSAYGIFFIKDGAAAKFRYNGFTKSAVVVGDTPGTRPSLVFEAASSMTGTDCDLVLKNVSITMDALTGVFINNRNDMGDIVIDDCYMDLKWPLSTRYSYNSISGNMGDLEVLDSDILVDWASGAAPSLMSCHVGGATFGNLTVKNNVFWSADGKKEFHICATNQNTTSCTNTLGAVVVSNNTFYNVNNGTWANSLDRSRNMVMATTVTSFQADANIVYDSAPDSKTTDTANTRPHITWMFTSGMTVSELQAVTTVTTKNIVNIAESCWLRGSDGKDWSTGVTNLLQYQSGSGNTIVESWTNPFKAENAAEGYFETTDAYSAYGAVRK